MLNDFYSTLVLNEVTQIKDEYGSFTEGLRPILSFKGAITASSISNKEYGDQLAPSSVYMLTTSRKIPIEFGQVIMQDKATFRVVSEYRFTPKSAGLDIKQYNVVKVKYKGGI